MSLMAHLNGSLRSSTEYFTVAKTSAEKAAAIAGAMAQLAAIWETLPEDHSPFDWRLRGEANTDERTNNCLRCRDWESETCA